MSSSVAIDRRILRAFYTQYVAVLLILLVLCVGSASNDRQVPVSKLDANPEERVPLQIGVVGYEEFFTSDTSATLREGPELLAVIETLRNHDVRATFKVYADVSSGPAVHIERTITRAHALRTRLLAASMPVEAFRIVVTPTTRPRSQVEVVFEAWGRRDELS
jgi:hypothetical protein